MSKEYGSRSSWGKPIDATLIEENIYLKLVYIFRGLMYYYHGSKHGSMQVDKRVTGSSLSL